MDFSKPSGTDSNSGLVQSQSQQNSPSVSSPWGHGFLRASTCSAVGPPWAAGGFLLHAELHVSTMSCRAISALAPGALPFSLSLTLVSAKLLLSHCLTPLPRYNCSCTVIFSFSIILTYPRGTTTIAVGLSLGQKWVHLGPSWHWLQQTQGKLLAAHKSHPCSFHLEKLCHSNPIQICTKTEQNLCKIK